MSGLTGEKVTVLNPTEPSAANIGEDTTYADGASFGAKARALTAEERLNTDYQVSDKVFELEFIESVTTNALEPSVQRLRFRGETYDIELVDTVSSPAKMRIRRVS